MCGLVTLVSPLKENRVPVTTGPTDLGITELTALEVEPQTQESGALFFLSSPRGLQRKELSPK
jgi:hypothetical protein